MDRTSNCPWPPMWTAIRVRRSRGSPAVELLGWLLAQLVVTAILWSTIGLGPAGIAAGTAYGLGLCWLLLGGLRRSRAMTVGPANRVTLARAVLTGGVLALVADQLIGSSTAPAAVLVPIAAVALALDGVDGQVARRTGSATELGARFDNEADAFLVLVLSVAAATVVGPWVLAIGAMRYAYVAAARRLAWLRAPLPASDARRLIGLAQGVGLLIVVSDLLPPTASVGVTGVLLALLLWSFGRDVAHLWRTRACQ